MNKFRPYFIPAVVFLFVLLLDRLVHATCTCNVSPSGDSSGATDRAAIQACIDGFGSSGGQVVLAIGTFYIDSPITLKSDITVEGAGSSSTILKWTTDVTDDWSYLFGYEGSSSGLNEVTVKDLKINGQDYWIVGVLIDGGGGGGRASQITVRDAEIINCGEYGIHMKQTDGIFIRDVTLSDNGHSTWDPSGNNHNHNIYLRDDTQAFVESVDLSSAETNGMNLTNVTDAVVSSVTANNNEAGGIRIASDDYDDDDQPNDGRCTDADVEHSERVRLSDCETNDNGDNGLEIQREDCEPDNIDICIERTTSTGNDEYGLLIRYTEAHELSGNTISGNTGGDTVYEYGASASDETSGVCGRIPSDDTIWPFDRTGYNDPGTGSTDCDGDGYESTADGGSDCNDATLTGSGINRGASEICGDGVDQDCDGVDPACDGDGDGIADGSDNCSSTANAAQTNTDGDSQGDACDDDDDNDGYADATDCQSTNNGINPSVSEICGDTIDQNCDGVDPSCDTDGDGLSDSDEAALGTSPSDTDSDDDGLDDGNEVGRGTDPTDTDSDDDYLSDYQEILNGSNPLVYTDWLTPILSLVMEGDDDGDGYDSEDDGGEDCDDGNADIHPRATEACDDIDNNCDDNVDPDCDNDGDGLTNSQEIAEGSNPDDASSTACVPPSSGTDWNVTHDCTFTNSKTHDGPVTIQNNAVMTIPYGITLDLDFVTHKLVVQSGSGVLIQERGKVY